MGEIMLNVRLAFAIVLGAVAAAWANEPRSLRLAQTIPMPNVEGRIDHLAVNIKSKRPHVAALGNNTVEVIDLAAGKVMRRITGIKEPQGILYLAGPNRLVVTAGKEGTCRLYDAGTFEVVKVLSSMDDADNLRHDVEADRIYVAYGDGALAAIDPTRFTNPSFIRLRAHPESFQLEKKGKRIFVNVPDARQVAVVDRAKGTVIAEWPVHEAHANYPMALDEAKHRLFIGCRQPAKILVIDTESGKVLTAASCAGDTDDVFFDARRGRLYVSCGEGFLDVFDTSSPDALRRTTHIPTAAGARTCLFVPDLHRLYLAVPHRGKQPAEIGVFEATP